MLPACAVQSGSRRWGEGASQQQPAAPLPSEGFRALPLPREPRSARSPVWNTWFRSDASGLRGQSPTPV